MSGQPRADSTDERRTDLDALRGGAMILGIALHAMMSFIPSPWPVQDTRQNDLFFIPYAAIHMFRMPLFFLISGFFTMFILRRHGLGGMLRQRVRRILLPLLLALITIVPVDSLLKSEIGMICPDPGSRGPLVDAILSGDQAALMERLTIGDFVNQEDPACGLTPLCWAALSGNDRAVSLLLERGADLQGRDKSGNTPLHEAALLCHPRTVRLLLEHRADPSARNKSGETSLGICATSVEYKRIIASRYGLELPDDIGLRGSMDETLAILSQPRQSTSLSAWMDRASARYRAFLCSNHFLIRVNGLSLHLFDEALLDHLWFLWLLLWLVAGVGLAVRMGFPPSGRFLWWLLPLTLVPQALMGAVLGPDIWLGPLPPPHLLLYYGLFFWFGAAVFSRDGMGTRMGHGWQILLPVGLIILLPAAFLLIGDRLAGSVVQCGYAWAVSLGVMGLFGRYRSRLGYRARWFSDSAYWMYLAHLPLVLAAQIAVVCLPWPPSLKFLLIMAVVTPLLLTSYRWLVRYTWIGTLLNGPRKQPQAE